MKRQVFFTLLALMAWQVDTAEANKPRGTLAIETDSPEVFSQEETNDGPAFLVTVDPNQPLGALIESGKYGGVDDKSIAAQNWLASHSQPYEAALELICFPHAMTTREVLKTLDLRGLRAASGAELLVVGALEPELRTEAPIVALGTILGKGRNRRAPAIYWLASQRHLGLFKTKRTWPANTIFLVTYK